MDTAVSIVRAYLQANGYFTMTEVPVIETTGDVVRSATDLDVLAVRFPGEHRTVANHGHDWARDEVIPGTLDPAIGDHPDFTDFIIGEVKEGRAELNAAATEPHVLRVALCRFGAFPHDKLDRMVADLRHAGETREGKSRVRLFAFGSYVDDRHAPHGRYTVITHRQILDYFARLFKGMEHLVPHMQTKDPFVGVLMVMLKSGRFRM